MTLEKVLKLIFACFFWIKCSSGRRKITKEQLENFKRKDKYRKSQNDCRKGGWVHRSEQLAHLGGRECRFLPSFTAFESTVSAFTPTEFSFWLWFCSRGLRNLWLSSKPDCVQSGLSETEVIKADVTIIRCDVLADSAFVNSSTSFEYVESSERNYSGQFKSKCGNQNWQGVTTLILPVPS